MSDESDGVPSATITDLLLGMASAVVDAQHELAGARTHDGRGRPRPTYLLPELEFELRVATQLRAGSDGHQELRVRPIRPGESGESGHVSTLRGRFVALPSSPGPPLAPMTEVEPLEPHARRVLVTLRAGGQPAADEVRLVLDPEAAPHMVVAIDAGGPRESLAPTPLATVCAGIGEQLERVDRSLSARRSTYRMGKLSLELKLVPSHERGSVCFMGVEDLEALASGSMSTLALEFVPTPPEVEHPGHAGQVVEQRSPAPEQPCHPAPR